MTLVKDIFKIPQQKWTDGEVGLEIEVEGENLPRAIKGWVRTTDGSLQGPEAYEYVLAGPMLLDGASKALKNLADAYHNHSSNVHDSVRAGVHVHVNMQNNNIVDVYNFITLYLIFEELLVRWCGPTREGNLFCLRACDAEWLLKCLSRAARTRAFHQIFHDDDLRYASVNVKALTEHGSLEFRSMRGTANLTLVDRWMRMLTTIRDKSLDFEDPIDIITGFSGANKRNFIEDIMGMYAPELLALPDWDGALFSGMRSAQDVAYSLQDWAPLKSMAGSNPFKKDEIAVLPDPLEEMVRNRPRPAQGFVGGRVGRMDGLEVPRFEPRVVGEEPRPAEPANRWAALGIDHAADGAAGINREVAEAMRAQEEVLRRARAFISGVNVTQAVARQGDENQARPARPARPTGPAVRPTRVR